MAKLQMIKLLHVVRSNHNMGSEDTRLWEDAISTLRDENYKLKQMNTELKQQNLDLKEFFKHMDHAIASYPRYRHVIQAL